MNPESTFGVSSASGWKTTCMLRKMARNCSPHRARRWKNPSEKPELAGALFGTRSCPGPVPTPVQLGRQPSPGPAVSGAPAARHVPASGKRLTDHFLFPHGEQLAERDQKTERAPRGSGANMA